MNAFLVFVSTATSLQFFGIYLTIKLENYIKILLMAVSIMPELCMLILLHVVFEFVCRKLPCKTNIQLLPW